MICDCQSCQRTGVDLWSEPRRARLFKQLRLEPAPGSFLNQADYRRMAFIRYIYLRRMNIGVGDP